MRLIAAYVASSILLLTACSAENNSSGFAGSANGVGGSSSANGGHSAGGADAAGGAGVGGGGGGGGGGACTDDFTSDPNNCGLCGHDCLGGECLAGSCQPVSQAFPVPNPVGIYAHGDTLYITSNGVTVGDYRTFSMTWDGSPSQLYQAPDIGPFGHPLVVGGDRLLFVQNDKLLAIATEGASSYANAKVLQPNHQAQALWLYGDYVYAAAAASAGGVVRAKWDVPNGSPDWQTLAAAGAGIAADKDGVFFAVPDTGELIHSALDGSSPELLHTFTPPVFDVTTFGDNVVVNTGGPALWRRAKDGSSEGIVVDEDPNNQSRPFSALGGGTFYWCDGQTGDVYHLPAMGAGRLLVTGEAACRGMAFANGVLYWIAGGQLNALAVLS